MSQEDYERGQRHGNESRFARPSSIVDRLGGDDYVKGLDATYQQRCDNAGIFGSTDNSPIDTSSTSSSTETTSSDGTNYGRGGGGEDLKSGNWGCVTTVIVVIFALWLLGTMTHSCSKQQARQAQPRVYQPPPQPAPVQAYQPRAPAVKKRVTPRPQPRPVEQIQLTNIVLVSAPYLPPGTQITVWTVGNDVKTRILTVARASQSNGTLNVVLAEEIPVSQSVRVNWVFPQRVAQPNPLLIQAQQRMYQPQQYAPRQFSQQRSANHFRGNQQQLDNRQQRHR